jgi:acetylornithine deacetylase/succinyl-diaminopimelate desuccinylase-like protein
MLEEMAGDLPSAAGPAARQLVKSLANLPAPASLALRQLLRPRLANRLLEWAGDASGLLDPLLHNTAVPTIVRAGEKRNVIPRQGTVMIDGRLLPGQEPNGFLDELMDLLGSDVELEVLAFDEAPSEIDYGLFGLLADIVGELDPGATPIPMLLPAVTDGRFFARLGIQSYGFVPLRLDRGFSFVETIHGADERVPIDALEFGTQALSQLLTRYGG